MKRDRIRLLALADLHFKRYGVNLGLDFVDSSNEMYTGRELIARLDELLRRKVEEVDHIIIAGDLTNWAHTYQYGPIEIVLNKYDGRQISVVPGNHDMMLNPVKNLNRRKYQRRFDKYLGRFMTDRKDGDRQYFPYEKKLDEDVVIIGLDTTTGIGNRYRHSALGFSASIGRVGLDQRQELESILNSERLEDKWILLVMHHDPLDKQHFFTRLGDIDSFREILAGVGKHRKVILICGHNHKGIIDYFGDNVLHIQPPAFCGQRAPKKGGYFDITVYPDLSYELNEG